MCALPIYHGEGDGVQARLGSDAGDEVALLGPGRGVVVGLVQHRVADHAEVEAQVLAVEDRARRVDHPLCTRSDERRVGTEWVSPCTSRWAPITYNKKTHRNEK